MQRDWRKELMEDEMKTEDMPIGPIGPVEDKSEVPAVPDILSDAPVVSETPEVPVDEALPAE